MRQKYSTDLTNTQWAEIEPLFVDMRNRKWEKKRTNQCSIVFGGKRL